MGEEIQKRAEELAAKNMETMFATLFANMFSMGKQELIMEMTARLNNN